MACGRGSYAGYRVDEVLNDVDVTVTGRTEQVTAAMFDVDVASIATYQPSRDDYFRTQAVNTAEHPSATFRLDDPIEAGIAFEMGQTVDVEATGTLAINGFSKTVTALLTVVAT